jgi:hypothetical protein
VEEMNIFYIDHDPAQAAMWMVDKHVVKMILESAQLLSTAHRVLDGVMQEGKRLVPNTLENPKYRKHKTWILNDQRQDIMYQATHINHPSAVWSRTSIENYNWLVEHYFALMSEYTYRYNKRHKCFDMAYYLQSPPKNLEAYDWTPMPSCMAEEYIVSDDPLTNYRNYYRIGKANMHKWTNRTPPEWIHAA